MSTSNTDQPKEEDYNLNDETIGESVTQARPSIKEPSQPIREKQDRPPRPSNFQRYQQQDGVPSYQSSGTGRLFQGRKTFEQASDFSQRNTDDEMELSETDFNARIASDLKFLEQIEKEVTQAPEQLAKEFSAMPQRKLQEELFQLIKTKIDNGDRQQAQVFLKKLNELASKSQLKIDSYTLMKIEELLKNRNSLTDLDLIQKEFDHEAMQGQKIQDSIYEGKEPSYRPLDTFKPEPIQFADYEYHVTNLFLEFHNEQNPQEKMNYIDIIENEVEEISLIPNDIDEYDALLNERRQLLQQSTFDIVKDDFSMGLERVTNESSQLKTDLNTIENLKLNQEQQQYAQLLGSKTDIRGLPKLDSSLRESLAMNLQEVLEIKQDVNNAIRGDLRNQYELTRNLMRMNQQLRSRLVSNTKLARQALAVTTRQREKLTQRLDTASKDHASDAMPNKVYDFIKQEQTISRKEQIKEVKALISYRSLKPGSKNVEDYNLELTILAKMHQLQKGNKATRKLTQNLMQAAISYMQANEVEPNAQTHARFFEYAVLSKNVDLANRKLKEILAKHSDQSLASIDLHILEKFYKQSLRSDNFDGVRFSRQSQMIQLGHVIGYVEKHDLNIASWPLHQFKSSLDYYLNRSFNLPNLLTFTRYYTYINQCKLEELLKKDYSNKSIDQLSDSEKYALNKKLFSDSESLVDMRSLFSFLIEKIDTKEALDPITKQDVMWNIIDFFTRRGMSDLQNRGETNFSSIDENDMALYFKNHINGSKTFERVTHVILRHNEKGQTFQNSMIQHLKEYQANNNGSMPFSFELFKVRQSYIKIKNARESMNAKFSEKTLEYFLQVFKSLNMWPEIVDLCESFNHLSHTEGDSEIRQFYLSDALLRIPSTQHYHNLVQDAVYQGKEDQSAGYITAMTKAYFKDGSVNHALKFFQDKILQLTDVKVKREDFLINLFDSVYTEDKASGLTLEQFRDHYLNVILLSQKSIKESFAIHQLEKILHDKDYDEIETMFQLYLVEKEETNVLRELRAKDSSLDLSELRDIKVDEIGGSITEDRLRQRLHNARERKEALQSMLTSKDVKTLMELKELMGQDTISIFKGLDTQSADELQQTFNIKSKAEIKEILHRTDPLYKSASNLLDQHTEVFQEFEQIINQLNEQALEEAEEEVSEDRNIPDDRIRDNLFELYHKKKLTSENKERLELETLAINQYLLENNIVEDEDPLIIMQNVHDQTLIEMKEELLEAVNSRRADVLKAAVKIFNKIQQQTLQTVKLNELDHIDEKNVDLKKINETLDKCELLLNDQRSPVLSALKTMALHKGEQDIISFNEVVSEHDGDMSAILFDVEGEKKENEHLSSLNEQLVKTVGALKTIQTTLLQDQQDMNSNKYLYEKEYQKISAQKDQKFEGALEKRIQQLYQEYKQTLQVNKGVESVQELPREEKLSLLRDIFTIEYQDSFTNNLFPAFYSQDLIIFGMENNIPEAIRLGEQMMSQNGQKLSRDLQIAMKDYLFNHSEKYQQAMKNTGPIDNASLYRSLKNKSKDEQPVIFSKDDPYWQEIMSKSWKRTQQWKAPSMFAWDHKRGGLQGDAIPAQSQEDVMRNMKYMRSL